MNQKTERVRRSGALFKVGDCSEDDFRGWMTLLQGYPREREVVQGIYDLCREDPELTTDMPSLEERLNIRRPTILKRLGPLLELGVIKVRQRQVYAGLRSVNQYQLQLPPLTALPSPRSTEVDLPEPSEQARFDFSSTALAKATQLHYHPEINKRLAWKGERFVVFALLSGLRVGRTGKETRHKQTRIYLGSKYFDLEVRASETAQIPSVIDLRVLIVVCTLIKDHLQNALAQGTPANGFLITMTEICQAMGLDPAAGNKRNVFEQLARWRSSEFIVRQEMYGALEWAKGQFEINVSFSVINELMVMKHASAEGTTPEVIHLTLNERLLEALLDVTRTLSVHREILYDRNPKPIMHLVYYWCRRVVQHAPEPRVFSLAHLHRELRPHLSLKKFRAEFVALMQEYKQDGQGRVALIPGYILRYDRSQDEVSIIANPHDVIVGQRSPKQQQEAVAKRTLFARKAP